MKYDLNDGASDVILCRNNYDYTNLHTGKKSSNLSDVTRDKHYIVLFNMDRPLKGYRLFQDKKKLVCIAAEFIETDNGYEWQETASVTIKKSLLPSFIKRSMSEEEISVYKVSTKNVAVMMELRSRVDICGQYCKEDWAKNKACGAKETMVSFFGYKQPYLEAGISKNYLSYEDPFWSVTRCFMLHNEIIAFNKGKDMPVRDSALATMGRYISARMEEVPDPTDKIGYIHCEKGCAFLRSFRPVIIRGRDGEPAQIYFTEVSQIILEKKASGMCTMSKFDFDTLILYADDMTGTPVAYTGDVIKAWLDMAGRYINSGDITGIRKEQWDFRQKYGIEYTEAPFLSVMLANMPEVEKVYKMKTEEYYMKSEIAKRLHLASDCSTRFSEIVYDLFGQTDKNGKTLNAILCIPKGLLEESADIHYIHAIKEAKEIFLYTPGSKKLFFSMNREDVKFLCAFLKKIGNRAEASYVIESIKTLIAIYGAKNWKKYISHTEKLGTFSEIFDFWKYTRYLLIIGTAAKKSDWALSGAALSRKIINIQAAYNLSMNRTDSLLADSLFKSREEEYKKYNFEYRGLVIRYPESCKDLIKEGEMLHHCVSKFIEKASGGETTILFIRRKKAPDKPFYTLEIKNQEIRQCHGFGNKNATSEVMGFLYAFCKQKNILFSKGSGLYGY